jgi:hypothetical protein
MKKIIKISIYIYNKKYTMYDGKNHRQSKMIYKFLSFAATVHYFASFVSAETVDASSLTDKVLFGYQGGLTLPLRAPVGCTGVQV